jgi:hypothetical protein
MPLIPWAQLTSLSLQSDSYYLLFRIPETVEEWAVGIHVTSHLNNPELGWNTFSISTRMGKNMTLSRKLPGRIVYKAILLACRGYGVRVDATVPHAWMEKRNVSFHTGESKASQLVEVFHCYIWLLGVPKIT